MIKATLMPADLDCAVSSAARRVKVGAGKFGWWVGVLSRETSPRWDVWHCGHQHDHASEARDCVSRLIYALRGESDPVRLRND